MKNHFVKTVELLKCNFRTLFLFEILYRLVGLLVVYPIVNQLLVISIRLTGNQYIISSGLFDYLYKPTTIMMFLLIFIVFALYVTYEIIALSILFHTSSYNETIGLQTLLIASFRRARFVFKRYHLLIMSSSMIFFLLVEGLHVAGIASTINMPTVVVQELNDNSIYYIFIGISLFILILLFIETIFFELQCTVETPKIKENFTHSTSILKQNRLKLISEFLFINGLMNGALYLIYIIILAILSFVIRIFYMDIAIFGYILTLFYSIYLVIGLIATIFLLPVNFAWINVWYYENKKTPVSLTQKEILMIKRNKPLSNVFFQRLLGSVSLLLLVLSVIVISNSTLSIERISVFNNPSIISHRGAGDYAPENTLSSIDKGLELGADAIEIDVRFTSDGIPVLMHDTSVTRTTDEDRYVRVNQLTLDEIKELDAGSWYSAEYAGEQIPTLEEALAHVNKRTIIYIDLKDGYQNSADILVTIINNTDMQDHVKILSFKQTLLEEIKEKEPKIETLLLLNSFLGDIDSLTENDSIDYYGFKNTYLELNSEVIFELQSAGKGVYVWTINDIDRIRLMNELNVDGIITDTPVLAREVVYSDNTNDIYTQIIQRLFKRQ